MPRLPVFLFVAALALVVAVLAAACGGGNGRGSVENAIRDTARMMATACQEGDSEKQAELSTAGFPGCPPGGIQNLEILSVTEYGDLANAEITRTGGDLTIRETLAFVKRDDIWLVSDVTSLVTE